MVFRLTDAKTQMIQSDRHRRTALRRMSTLALTYANTLSFTTSVKFSAPSTTQILIATGAGAAKNCYRTTKSPERCFYAETW
jgi:hypothetical protein